MKQRIGLARALINNPKILFLDEPTLGLDPRGQEDIQNLLKQLNKQGVTIFFSSHQLNEVANLCSTIAIINHGKLVAQGTIEEIQKQANLLGSSLKDIFLNLTNE
jgi:ABC-type multidrug transport system ATPase subunit